jgi:hypothetical protein
MAQRNKLLWMAFIHVLAATSVLHAQSGIEPIQIERAGQSGWQFLKINGDARQAAMGGAFAAISSGDANAIFGNPAALADVKGVSVQVNTLQWVADIGHQSIAVAASLGNMGIIGASVVALNYGDIPETINSPLGGGGTSPLVTGSTFTANDIAAGISYARQLTEKLSIGGNVRWMKQTIAELSMQNWSLDIGTLYYTGYRSLRIAIVARNFGPDSRFGGWSEQYQSESDNVRMPLDFRAGVAMDFLDDADSPHLLTVVVEGDHPNDGREKFHVGVSYGFEKTFFLRGGYRFNYDVQTLTFGMGIQYSFGDVFGTLNYAYLDFGELTRVHMISLGVSL